MRVPLDPFPHPMATCGELDGTNAVAADGLGGSLSEGADFDLGPGPPLSCATIVGAEYTKQL